MANEAQIILKDVAYEAGRGFFVLKNINLNLAREKVGLVGKNGIGKTTLLDIIAGDLRPSAGSVKRDTQIGYLPQDYKLDLEKTVADLVKESDQCRYFDITNLDPKHKLKDLSGGERMKLSLMRLLTQGARFLILDEPTNNLDRESRQIVYQLIKMWSGGMMIVSHDRELLRLVDRIIELSDRGLKSYGGNYDSFIKQKETETAAARKLFSAKTKELKKTIKQAHIAKERQQKRVSRGKKSRDKLGMAKIILGKMKETSEKTSTRVKAVHSVRVQEARKNFGEARSRIAANNRIIVRIPNSEVPRGKLVLKLDAISFKYPNAKDFLIKNMTLSLYGPVRISIAGSNGSGKTTLVKLITGHLRSTKGKVYLGVERFIYLDQSLNILDKNSTLLENLKNISGLDENFSRKWLADFLFSGEDVFKKVSVLSGGERMKAALACVLAGNHPPHLLILDEPTNNLDLDSIEQIESSLLNFRGALMVISHDQQFLHDIGVEEEITLSLG